MRGGPAVHVNPGLPVVLLLALVLGWLRFVRQLGTGRERSLHHGRCLWQPGLHTASINGMADFFNGQMMCGQLEFLRSIIQWQAAQALGNSIKPNIVVLLIAKDRRNTGAWIAELYHRVRAVSVNIKRCGRRRPCVYVASLTSEEEMLNSRTCQLLGNGHRRSDQFPPWCHTWSPCPSLVLPQTAGGRMQSHF